MIDAHVLNDAIRRGLLPAGSTLAKVTPELRFEHDDLLETGERIDALLEETHRQGADGS